MACKKFEYICTRSSIYILYIIFTSTQEYTTISAAPSKSIHSSTKKIHIDMTGTDKQNITSKCPAILLYAGHI
jgi:hypothetical protein